MDEDGLPKYTRFDDKQQKSTRVPIRPRKRSAIYGIITITALLTLVHQLSQTSPTININVPPQSYSLDATRLEANLATCAKLHSTPQDPSGPRTKNARYVDGHPPVLIRNATYWTGEPVPGTLDAYAWVTGDVLMEEGMIVRVGGNPGGDLPDGTEVYEAQGRMVSAGIVDMHSHTGVDSLPNLRGFQDTNELSSDITPYVRSIDGINPLDHQIQVIKSGGVTTSLILPGSGNNMGGEAYVIKHAVGKHDGRTEISAEDMLADPEKNWRYMKMACGENAKRVYGRVGRDFGPFSRLGEAWYFRHAFEEATQLVQKQDDWCAMADRQGVANMDRYLPESLEWESLGALLRGQVLLNTHCYTIPDLEAFVRHTNEFKFKIRAFHHAHQTYIVPEILKRAYGGRPPAAALFADNMYYKAEAYTASEQAGKILYENGITPVYVSDNPVLNAQHVVFEAAKAYRNGLPYHVALAGVTSASAELLGLGERIGKIKPGFDADIVVWDSDPLSVGAAPVQVWIDGMPQFEEPVELDKPVGKPLEHFKDREDARLDSDEYRDVVFIGVKKVLLPGQAEVLGDGDRASIVVRNATITCIGACMEDINTARRDGIENIRLRDGHVVPPATAFGSGLGLSEIDAEPSTNDGENSEESFSLATDGLAFETKQLKAAYSHGVTRAITAPLFEYVAFKGVSAGFATNAHHALEEGAVWAEELALHYALTKTEKTPSLSSAVGALRTKLLKAVAVNETTATTEEKYLHKAVQGSVPLAITLHSADTIAALLKMKHDIETMVKAGDTTSTQALHLIIIGAAESYILATELAEANVGVVLAPLLPYSESWDQRRSLTGAPLTNGTTIDALHAAGVKVAIGTKEDWETRDLYLSAGIAYANGGGKISEKEALAFVSGNIYDMLQVKSEAEDGRHEFVVFDGNPLEIDGKVRAVADGRGHVTVYR